METRPGEKANDRLLKEVNAAVRRRSSSTNSNDFVVDANTQNALSQIKTRFKGAMCDSEGFYQHEGECWNDAIQMVFLFSDGLKEIVQEKLANNEVDINFIPRESIPVIISRYNNYRDEMIALFKDQSPETQSLAPPYLTNENIIESLLFYLQFLKHRFARHYTMESERREEECKPNRNPIKILHTKGKNAELAAMFGNPVKMFRNPEKIVNTLKEFKLKGKHGATDSQMEYLVDILIYTFFPVFYRTNNNGFRVKRSKVGYSVNSSHFTTYEYTLTHYKPYAILLNISNHSTCLYTCGENDFFYEDNYGPFLFPWKDIFFKVGLQFGDIISVLFMTLKINSRTLTTCYPVIRTKDNNYFTYYNTILYNFPQNMFDSKPSSEEPTLYSFDTTITFSFDYKEDKQIILDNKNECMLSIMKAVGVKSLENSNISNRGFTFKRNARLNNEFKRKQKAKQYGIPLNSPILNWEEGTTSNNGRKFWHNPIRDQFIYDDPYLIAQKTPEELRLELKLRGITPPVNASHIMLVNELLEAPQLSTSKKLAIQRAKQYGIPLNSPILNWEEGTFNNGSKFWHNRITDQYVFNDPFVNFQSKSLKEVAPINSPVANWQEILSNNGRKQWYSPSTGKLTYNDPYEVKGGFVRKTLKIKSYRDKSNTRSRRSL